MTDNEKMGIIRTPEQEQEYAESARRTAKGHEQRAQEEMAAHAEWLRLADEAERRARAASDAPGDGSASRDPNDLNEPAPTEPQGTPKNTVKKARAGK